MSNFHSQLNANDYAANYAGKSEADLREIAAQEAASLRSMDGEGFEDVTDGEVYASLEAFCEKHASS